MTGSLSQFGAFIATGNPFTVSEGTPFAQGQLGKVTPIGGNTTGVDPGLAPKVVQFIKRYASDTTTMVAGDAAYWQDMDNFVVTGEIANAVGGTTAGLVAGVFGSASPSAASYGFVQVAGVAPGRFADSTSAAAAKVGSRLVFVNAANEFVVPATNASANLPTVGVLISTAAATGTHVSAEILLAVPRHSW